MTREESTHRLEFRDVTKTYRRRGGAVVGLEPLTLTLGAGESVALAGPNGAGKTTALRIAATLVEPTSGVARVCGHDVVRAAGAARASIGVSLGGARSFYWRLSARRNLAFFAALAGLPPGGRERVISALASELGLERLLALPARRLSRGALARLGVARALLASPLLVILDEPFASVDEAGRRLILEALARRTEAGSAVLIASHGSEVLAFDRVVRLDRVHGGAARTGHRAPGRAARVLQ
jgi:ABC-2 type transport system ATP-binding protein